MVDYIGYWIFTKEDQCTGTVFLHSIIYYLQRKNVLTLRTSFQICFTFSKLKGGRSTNANTVI
jgi:hypothetical protein